MSTKIGHGHLYTGTDVFDLVDSLTPTFHAVAHRLDAREVATRAFDLLSSAQRHAERDGTLVGAGDWLWKAYRAYDGEQREISDRGWFHARLQRRFAPNEAELDIGREPVTGKYLLLLHAEAGEYFEALRAHPDVREYSYTTAHDGLPDGVTRAQYTQRGKEWDRLLGDATIPERMLRHRFRDPAYGSNMQQIASAERTETDLALLRAEAPTTHARAVRLVTNTIAEQAATNLGDAYRQDSWGQIGAIVHDIAMSNRDDLINLAETLIAPSETILEAMLTTSAPPARPDLAPLDDAVAVWLETNPVGQD